jgi:putative DNA primase/helicase|tara:strand:+ start:6321 stop:7238 length:918 start_codon:yes stop_codon:yes gene_type:complete
MKTVDAAKGNWDTILTHYGLRFTNNRHIQCPICERKGSSGIRINEYRGDCSWICVCGSGSGFNLLMEITGKPFSEVAKEIDLIIGNTHDYEPPKAPVSVRKAKEAAKVIKGSLAELYLKERGITVLPQMSVEFCESLPYYSDGKQTGSYPVMLSTVTDSQTLEVLQYHYTYLDGLKCIARKVRNITDTDYKSPVIRLMEAGKTLGIAEGIETALSASDKYNVPVWATVNSGFMKKFRAPPGITKLYIFADNDKSGTGHASAFECARANLAAKNDVVDVTVIWPESLGDFNDLDDKHNVCHWSFSK